MRGLPEELIILLFVGLFWLWPLLRRWLRQQQQAAQEAEQQAALEAAEEAAPARPAAPPAAAARAAAEATPRGSAASDELSAPRRPLQPPQPQRAPRRYTRSALMGDRRAVQNAVVAATVLQPCRAREPWSG